MDVVTSQGVLETMFAILGLLPTSQILLAGGGLIGLKMAIATRILSLLGLVSDQNQRHRFINPHKTLKNTDESTKYPTSAVPSSSSSGLFVNNNSSLTPHYYGLPKLDEESEKMFTSDGDEEENDVTNRSVDGGGNDDDGEVSAITPTLASNLMEPNAFFPIPGLQIDCENSTGICGILHMDSLFPSVFLPSEFANKSGIDYKQFENMSNPMFELFKQEQHGNQSFLFYPLYPTKVVSNNMHEAGLVATMNESQLILAHSNGSMVPASQVGEFNFHGFHGLIHNHDNDELDGNEIDTNENQMKRIRRKRLTEDNIEMYLTLVNRFDDEGCFSRLICEVGADPERFGKYGHTVDNLFQNLNQTEFDVTSDASHYIGHYKYGQINGFDMCGRSSICHQNLTQLIHPLNEL